jgi:hypothetical protein
MRSSRNRKNRKGNPKKDANKKGRKKPSGSFLSRHNVFWRIAGDIFALVLNFLFVWDRSHPLAIWIAWFLVGVLVFQLVGIRRSSVVAVCSLAAISLCLTLVLPPNETEIHGWLMVAAGKLQFSPDYARLRERQAARSPHILSREHHIWISIRTGISKNKSQKLSLVCGSIPIS